MPPRKSNVSQTATTGGEATPSKEQDGVNIEDLALPRTMVQRLSKGVLPANTQIQKDAISAMSKSATVFVNYLGQAANTSSAMGSRKTISQEAVLEALAELEFEHFLPRVQAELQRFNEILAEKRNEYRRKAKEKEVAGNGTGGEEHGGKTGEGGDGEERAAKRVRRDDEVVNVDSSTEEKKSAINNGTEVEEEEEEEEENEDAVEEKMERENKLGEENDDDEATEDDEEEGSIDDGSGEPSEDDDEGHDTDRGAREEGEQYEGGSSEDSE